MTRCALLGWVAFVGLLGFLAIGRSDAPAEVAARPAAPPADDGKLRILCFGAHPDDCELKAGGVAILWAARGHHVKFVSTTNGDIGHWKQAGGPLARRRKAEVEQAAKILEIATEVLDIHDGELMPRWKTAARSPGLSGTGKRISS